MGNKNKATASQLDFLSLLGGIPKLGPKRVAALAAAGIKNIGELLRYYPVKYIDRSAVIDIKDIINVNGNDSVNNINTADNINNSKDACSDKSVKAVDINREDTVTVTGTVDTARSEFYGRPKFRVTVKGGGGGALDAIWFIRSMKIGAGERLMLTGRVTVNRGGRPLMVHPVLEKLADGVVVRPILAVYAIREPMREAGVNQKLLRYSIEWALDNVGGYPQILPDIIEKEKGFPPLRDCLRQVHLPDSLLGLDVYRARLKYEELYRLALDLRWSRRKFALPGYAMSPGDLADRLRAELPFALTESQEAAVRVLHGDAARPARMHRLLQGDVGSGKTVTALFAALPALNSGRQVAWMAPTEILAKQTKSAVEGYLAGLGIRVGYVGAGDAPEKRRALCDLASGELRFAVGTHALFMPSVRFSNLGMIIIDEQHKFGAAQRLKLQEKGPASDFLLMSATPIPQTLAKTLYGDLDVAEIGPRPDRAAVSTRIVPEGRRADMEGFILERIGAGARVFYVVPRIDQQPSDDLGDEGGGGSKGVTREPAASGGGGQTDGLPLKTVDSVSGALKRGPLSSAPIHKLHGRMPADERDAAIRAFKEGPPGVLVSTTIVEVGVDVADAAVMVIENPEFFGLAQLHQIRGRVGRGGVASHCFLLPGPGAYRDARTMGRLKFLCGCADGFEIAERDLRNRGPGDAAGYRQSGWDDLLAADILEDAGMFTGILSEMDILFAKDGKYGVNHTM
ncbi:MAG: ATP-dependent DNA helicase RecG [Chitinispirillales bacterium]|jgi:ATP-dependent DNA helicase RecG|nr:ATP-dependent DNA helicase RecG [Chitinispirillales bacterium]